MTWDGEGADLPDGSHIYTYLANSDGNAISDPNGLSTKACLDFLLDESNRVDRRTLHTIYAMGYDVNMMVGDLPPDKIRKLWEEHTTGWGEYRISYRPNRMLSISRWWRRRRIAHITIWDSIGYSQRPFVEAVEEWLNPNDPRLPIIREGKQERGAFQAEHLQTFIPRYTAAELDALKDIETRMHEHLERLEIRPTRHDGAGSIAAALLKEHEIKEVLPRGLPPALNLAARHAYFGGRIEATQFGRTAGPIYHYDVNSAYPAAMLDLPNLREGTWSWNPRPGAGLAPPWSLTLVTWQQKGQLFPFYPLPYREDRSYIKFPPDGKGWYWAEEFNLAAEHPGLKLQVHGRWEFHPDTDERPFAWIGDLYQERRKLKKQGDHAQLVLKLALNSMYGKLAQRLGYNEKEGKLPPYHSLFYAGLVTSHTRAQLYRAAIQSPDAVLFFATDGLFSLAPHDVTESKQLGEWDGATHDEIMLTQPGVYFIRDGGEWAHKYRGWGRGVLDPERITEAWGAGEQKMTIPVRRFVGMGLATRQGWSEWRRWILKDRRLVLHPCAPNAKRRTTWDPIYTTRSRRNPAERMLATIPRPALGSMSTATILPWEGSVFDMPEDWEIR